MKDQKKYAPYHKFRKFGIQLFFLWHRYGGGYSLEAEGPCPINHTVCDFWRLIILQAATPSSTFQFRGHALHFWGCFGTAAVTVTTAWI